MDRTNWLKRNAVAATTALFVAVGAWVVTDVINNPSPTRSQPAVMAPPIENRPLQTNLQKVVASLGPFETLAVTNSRHPETKHPAVLLLRQDGSTAASQKWTLPFTPTSWSAQSDSPQITRMLVDGDYVTLQTSIGRTHVVHAGQPFIIESHPQTIMTIDGDGQLWQTSATRAQFERSQLTQH